MSISCLEEVVVLEVAVAAVAAAAADRKLKSRFPQNVEVFL